MKIIDIVRKFLMDKETTLTIKAGTSMEYEAKAGGLKDTTSKYDYEVRVTDVFDAESSEGMYIEFYLHELRHIIYIDNTSELHVN